MQHYYSLHTAALIMAFILALLGGFGVPSSKGLNWLALSWAFFVLSFIVT